MAEEEKSLFDAYLQSEKLELERRMNRPRRLLLADSLSTRVKESENPQLQCTRIVQLALDTHAQRLKENDGMCRLDKYHSILYVAAKLCTDWKLENTEIVCALLQAIFLCENTFERLMVTAIFGSKICHYYTGWHSDYDSNHENLMALEYFVTHSTLGRETFVGMGHHMRLQHMRFLEVAMESYNRSLPLYVTAYIKNPESLLVLLRFGAPVDSPLALETVDPPVTHILKTLSSHHNLTEYPTDWVMSLKFLLRAVPRLHVRLVTDLSKPATRDATIYETTVKQCVVVHPRLVLDGLLPPNRYLHPTELKHMCRCIIRQNLHDNWGLPHSIAKLPLPKTLQNYLDLLED